MKILTFIALFLVTSLAQAHDYIKLGDIKGEAMEGGVAQYSSLAKQQRPIKVSPGKESTLANGKYLRSDGAVVRIQNGRAMVLKQPSYKEKGSGIATGRRLHSKTQANGADNNCPDNNSTREKGKGKKCKHRGHVTVLK